MAIHVSTTNAVSLVSTWAFAVVGGWVPWLHRSPSQAVSRFMSLGGACAGGVFISVAFLHLLGDSIADMQQYAEKHGGYPYSLLYMSLGFLVTMALDDVGHALASRTLWKASLEPVNLPDETDKSPSWAASPLTTRLLQCDEAEPHTHTCAIPLEDSTLTAAGSGTCDAADAHLTPTACRDGTEPHLLRVPSPSPQRGSTITAVLVTVMLSFHSVFGGLALGLETDAAASLQTLVAILAHKGLAAFALGVSLIRAGLTSPKQYVLTMLAFSLTTPLGIVIGVVLEAFESPMWLAVCYAFTAGTFLYVGFVEMVLRELRPPPPLPELTAGPKAVTTGFVLLGYAVMAVVAIWT